MKVTVKISITFLKKVRLGILPKLIEAQIILILIQGLHPKVSGHFIAFEPKSFDEFYNIVNDFES